MTRMLSAKALARMDGWVTLARIVLLGPVLKNRQNMATNSNHQAYGKGVLSMAIQAGSAMSMAAPETRKYEPENLARNLSPTMPPVSVPLSPARTVIPPNIRLT